MSKGLMASVIIAILNAAFGMIMFLSLYAKGVTSWLLWVCLGGVLLQSAVHVWQASIGNENHRPVSMREKGGRRGRKAV